MFRVIKDAWDRVEIMSISSLAEPPGCSFTLLAEFRFETWFLIESWSVSSHITLHSHVTVIKLCSYCNSHADLPTACESSQYRDQCCQIVSGGLGLGLGLSTQ